MATARKIPDHKDIMHIEANGCIINIREKLHDPRGRQVTTISIIPDNNGTGELPWRVYPQIYNLRVVQLKKRPKPQDACPKEDVRELYAPKEETK